MEYLTPLVDNAEDGDDVVSLTDPIEATGISFPKQDEEFATMLEDLPQGRNYGIYASLVFIISRIVGTGIFSTPGGIYRNVGGSPFLFFLAWIIATIISFLCMFAYLELGTLMPKSGGPKVFLEKIYPRPKYLSMVIICLQSIIFGFTCTGALIFGQYFLKALGLNNDISKDNLSRYVGFGLIIMCAIVQSISIKISVHIQNVLGFIKLILLGILILTGLYVLLFPSNIENQLHLDKTFFEPIKPVSLASFTTAVLQAIFSFNGWESIYLISSEIENPIRTLKIVGPLSLLICLITYLFINIAYLKTISSEEIFNSGQLIGAILFEKVFGEKIGNKILSIIVALSAAGNVYAVLYGISRMSQEVFREGFLPFSRIMASNTKFGTPVPTLILSTLISGIFLLFPPPGDLFSYIVSLETYTLQMVMLAIVIGLFKLRKDYPNIKRPYKVPLIGPIVAVIVMSYVMITPLFGQNSSIPGLINYSYFAILLVLSFILFWFLKFIFLPKIGGYKLHREEETLDDGLVIKVWTKKYY